MGKCYYCDYCERYFKDAPAARTKHLTSLQHVKNKEEHYRHFKAPEKILQEEQNKKPCNRFFRGECSFGPVCKHSHYTIEQIHELQMMVAAKQQVAQNIVYPDPGKIVKEYFEDIVDPDDLDPDTPLFSIEPIAKDIPNLPVSLQPITLRNFKSMQLPEWGRQS
ncbi:zinc finger matrin-type protein 5 [Phymastichus coffea]|uniref:zinc finger matrin-type protein 5 n=1 Tax=Phymastichus coffea TaxID=108790 RepID=UPI00273C0518|nr:zinc finger matrin-type protein 5 [Phymastichus coffea]